MSLVNGVAGNVGNTVAGSNGGSFTINSDGSYSFTTGTDFDDLAVGETRDTALTYTILDADGAASTATVTVTVTGENDAPTLVGSIPTQTNDDSDPVSIDISGFFADGDATDVLTFIDGGTLPPGLSLDPLSGLITGTLDNSASAGGPYSVSITADDGNGGTTTQTFDWNVNNPGPLATDDALASTENGSLSGNVMTVDNGNGIDGDPDGDPIAVIQVVGLGGSVGTAVTGSSGGQFTINADGSYSFDPGVDFDDLGVGQSRTTAVTYTIADSDGATHLATVTVTVTGENDAPSTVGTIADQSNQDGDSVSFDASGSFVDPRRA